MTKLFSAHCKSLKQKTPSASQPVSVHQIHTLKDQLSQEMRRRQQNFKSPRIPDELRDPRPVFDSDLSPVTPAVDPLLLEHESRKLDDNFDLEGYSGGRRRRSPLRHSSPGYREGVMTSTPAYRRGRSPPASILRRSGKQ